MLAIGAMTLAAADTLTVTLPKKQRAYTGKEPMTFTLKLDKPADKAQVKFTFRNQPLYLNGVTSIDLKPSADKKVFTATINKLNNCFASSLLRRSGTPSVYVQFTPVVTRGGKATPGKRINPKFYLKLDQNVSDVMVSGIATQGDGKFGEAFCSGGKKTMGAFQKFKFNPHKGTIEFMLFMPQTISQGDGVVMFIQGGSPWSYHTINISPRSRKLTYMTYNGQKAHAIRTKKDIYEDDFIHVMATWDTGAKKMELFINGKSAGTALYDKPCGGTTASASFGGRIHYHKGTATTIASCQIALDEVRISGVVRKPVVPTKAYTVDNDTYVLLHFDGKEFLKDSAPNRK